MTTTLLIERFGVSAVLFTGVAGSLNSVLDVGDVVVGKDAIQHDFDARPLGFMRGQISYTDLRIFSADDALVEMALQAPLEVKAIPGRILTGDQFFTQGGKRERGYLRDELEGDCIEMEGAAVALVCHLYSVPHVIIRTMSDRADGTAVSDYNRFKDIVTRNSHRVVMHLLETMD